MITVNIHQAKTNLSKLLAMVESGQSITIARAGHPIAIIQPILKNKPKRTLGLMQGEIWVAEDFDAPLPDEILSGFEPNQDNWNQFFESKNEEKGVARKLKKTKKSQR